MAPQEIADAYFAAMRVQDIDGLLALFGEDGVIVWPDGREIAGHSAIREAYARIWQHPSNNPQPGPLLVAADCFACEVHSRLPDGSDRRTLNLFRIGVDGLVMRMDSYRQG